MDREKNKNLFDLMVTVHDGSIRLQDYESAECITRVFAAHSLKLEEFEESADYGAIFNEVIAELQRVEDAAYAAGLDKTGAGLNETWHLMRSRAKRHGLVE